MTEDYRNKVIIVTGASAGIGKELSLALLRKGGRVVACSRHLENLEPLEDAWERNEGELLTAGCDVSQAQDVQRLVDSALQRFGTIDYLVNNAGIYPCTPFLELSEQEWDQVQGTKTVLSNSCPGPDPILARIIPEREYRGRSPHY